MTGIIGPRSDRSFHQEFARFIEANLGRAAIGTLGFDVARLDDERVALPVPARFAHIAHDAREVATIEQNDAGVVHHFMRDRDDAWRLRDLDIVVVERRHDRAGHALRGPNDLVFDADVASGSRTTARPGLGSATAVAS